MRTALDRLEAWQRGGEAETLVARALEADGFVVLARNWRGGGAEVDLIVARDGRLRFVEVKARDPGDLSGLEAVDERKQARLSAAADAWLAQHAEPVEACFLVAVVTFATDGWTIEWVDDAFDGSP